jgi:predicted GNAT superfamily acetyltransferase
MTSQIQVRKLDSLSDQHLGRNVFDQTWAMDSGTEITPNLLQAMVHGGSYLSGAFINDTCVGAAFAFPATAGGLHLHSHMTAVLDEYRNQGVGYALKIDQWHWAKKNNFSEISWTFDPLVSRNAKFNLIKLGVSIYAYYPNFYGDMPDALNAGDESDRLMVSWKIFGEKPSKRKKNLEPQKSNILINIPNNIIQIRQSQKEKNLYWRQKVREEFMDAFHKGYKVIGFTASNQYVLELENDTNLSLR